MAWFGEGLPSLSNLKGQITNFTKEVLSDSLVESADEPSRQLKQVNEKCMELQELLNSRDAEIEFLRRQNSELQRTVVDLDAKSNQSFQNEGSWNEDGEVFWELPLSKNRDTEVQNQLRSLQDQLAQATMKIHELEIERKRLQKANDANTKEEVIDNHQKAELFRAKQDMMNRIIQIGEKGREAERNVKRLQMDESTLVNDFRMAISKLSSPVQLDLIKSALLALDSDNDKSNRLRKLSSDNFETVPLKSSQKWQDSQECERIGSNRETQLLQKIDELQDENKHLQNNIDELDQQHSASLDKLLSLKEELQKKHSALQNAYEKLYVEHNEALEKLAAPCVSTESQTVCLNREKPVQTEPTAELRTEELASKIEKLLKNTPIDREAHEDPVGCLARNYVESRWKQETLERRVTELTRELKQTSELKEAMQLECDDMQGNIETLLLEVQHLKSNLPAIPEASEERVASLETETESLQEELSKMQLENDCLKQLNSNVTKELRSQESIEAEVRNVKEQLELAQQQLAGRTEDEKGVTEMLSEKLNRSLDENNELRRRVDNLVAMENQMKEQLNMSLEKCKSLDETMELTEELKLDLQNVRCELVSSKENNKRLDASLQAVMEAKNEAERDNEILCKEKDRLEHELEMLKAGNRMDDHMVDILRDQLQAALQDKNDLEYDLMNVRKELDGALKMMEIKSGQLEKLGKENEKLAKENRDLIEQVAANDNESLDRIELLNTEKILLEQEYEAFKLDAASDRTKIVEMEERLKQLSRQLEEQEMRKDEADKQLEELVVVKQKLLELQARCREVEDAAVDHQELLSLRQKLDEDGKLIDSLKSELASQRTENERLSGELQAASEKHLEASQMARETIEGLSQLVRNKDDEMKKSSDELTSLRTEKEELVKLVQAKHNESLQYHAEIQKLTQVLAEQSSVVERLMTEKTKAEVDEVANLGCNLEEHASLAAQVDGEKERCAAFEAALIQEQASNRILQDQLNDSRSKEANTIRELERLRAHLIEVEENYTQETVQAEAKLSNLESQLQQAEELAKNSSTNYTSASIRANQQVESLQQQMTLIIQQRDEIQAKLSAAEDRALVCSASVTNLQSVLEHFQRDKEKDIESATERIRNQLQNSFDKQKELMNEISNLKDQLLEAKQCLQAASRLTEQLDQKNEKIGLLEEEVARLTELVNNTDVRIQEATDSVKGKVDKTLVKNLLLGFLSSPASDKSAVMRVFATVLDFNETERDRVGLNNTTAKNSWFSNLLSYNGPNPSKDDEASLSAAFIKFLEQESNPKPQLPALPISNTPIPKPSHSRQPSSSSTQSTLLLSNISLPTFPDFVPARNTGSILKEVLKDS